MVHNSRLLTWSLGCTEQMYDTGEPEVGTSYGPCTAVPCFGNLTRICGNYLFLQKGDNHG